MWETLWWTVVSRWYVALPLVGVVGGVVGFLAARTRGRGRPHLRRGEVWELQVQTAGQDWAVVSWERPPAVLNHTVQETKAEQGVATKPLRFVIDGLFLSESFEYLTREHSRGTGGGFREDFHYAAGVRLDENTYFISRLVGVSFAQQSAVGVKVADVSNIEALSRITDLGLVLVAHVHTHPGYGAGANHPSITDLAFQERLERGGHICIGAIFSRDGHLRFFAGQGRKFTVEIHGNNVERGAEHEYQLQLSVADAELSQPALR